MARMRGYDPSLVKVELLQDGRGKWDWLRRPVRGIESHYEVQDANYERFNRWVFVVQQPRSESFPIIVRPRESPAKAVWERIERRSIIFNRAKKKAYRNKFYCKLTLADPTGARTKIMMRKANRRLLPKWLDYFKSATRYKETVTTTKGRDHDHLVVLVSPDDHSRMIRLFFALKIWILNEGYLAE